MKKKQQLSIKCLVMWAAAAAPLLLGALFLYFLLPQPEQQKQAQQLQIKPHLADINKTTPKEVTTSNIVSSKKPITITAQSKKHSQHNPQLITPIPQHSKIRKFAPESIFSHDESNKVQQRKARPRIAIIIDDIGHQWPSSKQSAELNGAYTLAILPSSPFAEQAANLGAEFGKEIMLHAPMEPIKHKSWNGGLEQSMSEAEIKTVLADILEKVPLAIGINNHMGSAFTQNFRAMNWVMEAIAPRGLYFVDSRTSAMSEGLKAAQTNDVPSIKRDVFLDNIRDVDAIRVQLEKLVTKAKTKGRALGIGHPYPETLEALKTFEGVLHAEGVELVAVSRLLQTEEAYASNLPSTPATENSKKL